MFFVASKIVGFFLLPSNMLIALGLLGVVLMPTRLARAGRRLAAASIMALAVCGFSPLGQWLILPLEERFAAWDGARGAPEGIVVLGGAVDDLVSAARGMPALNEAAERMTEAVALARRYPEARVIFSGGSGRLLFEGETESASAERFFSSIGLDPGRIVFEDRSRNTDENAAFSRAIADPQPGERWLLVTSAFHMPRSVGVFRAQGFAVEAYPVDFRTRGTEDWLRPFERLSEGLRRTDIASREWVGLLAYRLTGRSSALLPGPES